VTTQPRAGRHTSDNASGEEPAMMRRVLVVLTTAILLAVTTAAPAAAWRSNGSSWENPDARRPLVLDLRYAQHANFDRVVIDIDGRLPGYRIGYTARHEYDGSGNPVPIRGGLWITLSPAVAHDRSGDSVYEGPRLVRPGFEALKAIAFTGDFEGQVSFAFGLDPRRTPYRVFRLHDPQRIVIDFKHE
jgi:hypothetical protein